MVASLFLGRPSSASARATTWSTVKPYSFITTSPGAEAPKRSTTRTSPSRADPALPAERRAGLDGEPRRHRRAAARSRDTRRSAARTAPTTASTPGARARRARAGRARRATMSATSEPVPIRMSSGSRLVGVEHVGAAAQPLGRRVDAADRASARAGASARARSARRGSRSPSATPSASRWRRTGGARSCPGSRAGWRAARPARASARPRRRRCCRACRPRSSRSSAIADSRIGGRM